MPAELGSTSTWPQGNGWPSPKPNTAQTQPGSTTVGSGKSSDWEHYDGRTQPHGNRNATSPIFMFDAPQNPSTPAQTSAAVPAQSQTTAYTQPNVEGVTAFGPAQDDAAEQAGPLEQYSSNNIQSQSEERSDVKRRHGSTTSIGTLDGIKRTGTIDSVIHAWNKPLSDREASSRPHSSSSGVSKAANERQVSSKEDAVLPKQAAPEPQVIVRTVDPYEDLEPEYRASLRRFALMLRNETAAEMDEEKFKIFQAFVEKELRLRSLLYGIEIDLRPKRIKEADHGMSDPSESKAQHGSKGHDDESATRLPHTQATPVLGAPLSTSAAVECSGAQTTPAKETTAPIIGTPQPKEESYVLEDASPPLDDDGVAYSPGGRPIVTKPAALKTHAPRIAAPAPSQSIPLSPSNDAPIPLEDYVTSDRPSPSDNAPILFETEAMTEGLSKAQDKEQMPINFEPLRPSYTPFRYKEVNSASNASGRPADEAYSSLRNQVADSGRMLAHDTPDFANSVRRADTGFGISNGRREHEEAFIGLLRQQSNLHMKATPDVSHIAQLRVGTPTNVETVDPLSIAVLTLRSLLPQTTPKIDGPVHSRLAAVKTELGKIPEEFGFIHDTVVEWDRTNREIRRVQDQERNTRQTESEGHIDSLFNDNEIAYADIGVLESEFKLAEAERKYHEDQQELESFVGGVFTPVTERLQDELSKLNAQYTIAVDILDLGSVAAAHDLRSDNNRPLMAEAMATVLTIFKKVEVRHQKLAEAEFERERRRKQLELTVLRANGNIAGMKQLEKDFIVAERMQVLQDARSKDTRANKLMDTFDRATVRGLGDNQTYVDELLVKVRALREALFSPTTRTSDDLYGIDGPRDTLSLAQETIDFVLADSRKLLATSNVADSILNDADYGVSIAEARVSDANEETYKKLQKDKAKEDAKICEDTDSRMNSISKSPIEATNLIREIVDHVGDDPHRERIRRALVDARMRNATADAG